QSYITEIDSDVYILNLHSGELRKGKQKAISLSPYLKDAVFKEVLGEQHLTGYLGTFNSQLIHTQDPVGNINILLFANKVQGVQRTLNLERYNLNGEHWGGYVRRHDSKRQEVPDYYPLQLWALFESDIETGELAYLDRESGHVKVYGDKDGYFY